MSIEVQLWTTDGTTMLAVLDGASSVQWSDLLGDVGSGSCTLSVYDSKYPLVQKGSLVKFCLGSPPVPAFAFFNTAPKLVVGEADSSVLTLAGNQVLDYLGRAAAYPPSWAGSGTYATSWTWTAETPGYALKTLIDAAQARGTIPALTYDFTATMDSAGNSWTANIDLTVDAKASILDVAKKLVALGIGIYMDPQLVLHAYIPGAQGANASGTVIWQLGRHFTAPVDNVGSMPTTVALSAGAAGAFVEVTDPAYTANPAYGRIETGLDYASVTGNTTQLTNAATAQISLSENAGQAITCNLAHGTDAGSFEPYRDYHLGDTVAINVPGVYANAPGQVVGLTLTQTPNADYTVEANLGSIALPIELRLARMLASASGTTSNVSGGVQGNLTLCNPKGFPSGSAFPLNPTTGMFWFRSDLGEWYWYNGAGWIVEAVNAVAGQALAPASVAATGAISGASVAATGALSGASGAITGALTAGSASPTLLGLPRGTCQTLVAGTAIALTGSLVQISTGSAITTTAVPTIPDGSIAGQQLVIIYAGGSTWTIKDQGTLAGSNVYLATSTFVFTDRDILELIWNGSDWLERGRSNNL